MTPDQFCALLKRCKLTDVEVANLLGRTERAIRNWKTGARRIPGPETRLLRLLAAKVITVEDIKKYGSR